MTIQAAVMVPHPPLIVPEVGKGEEQKIKDTIIGFNKAMELVVSLKPQTVVILLPTAQYIQTTFIFLLASRHMVI